MRPSICQVNGTLYWVLQTRDPDTMVLKDADSTPTVAVRKNGASVGDSVTVTKRSATTGIYDCSYNPASEIEGDSFTLEESATVTGTTTAQATYAQAWSVRVVAVERGTDLAALASGVNVTQIGGDAQSATDLKDFADAGYDPSTNKVQGVVLVDTTTALTNLPTIPTVNEIADGVWDEATAGHTTAGTYGGRVVRSTNSNVEVQITGSNHIAADVHDVQPDGLTNSTEIAAINTFATRVTTGIVQDGQVWQFTANMLELGPIGGGGGTVNVLPATGIVADRSAGTTLLPVVGETISQAITVYQSDGTTAVNLSGKTLAIIFETMSGTDVAVVANANITISGVGNNVVTFAYPSAVTASERVLRFAIRDAAAPLTMYLQGVCSVVAAPKVD